MEREIERKRERDGVRKRDSQDRPPRKLLHITLQAELTKNQRPISNKLPETYLPVFL